MSNFAASPIEIKTKPRMFGKPNVNGFNSVRYNGSGGIPIGDAKFWFAVRFDDLNILTSSLLKDNSRIMFNRAAMQRMSSAFPYVNYDADPYPVVDANGIYFVADGYSWSNWYPYSQQSWLNYVRPSVKAVLDMYNGTVNFYIMDPTDPIMKFWQEQVPGMFKPKDQMPESIKQHIRYPEDLFKIQGIVSVCNLKIKRGDMAGDFSPSFVVAANTFRVLALKGEIASDEPCSFRVKVSGLAAEGRVNFSSVNAVGNKITVE